MTLTEILLLLSTTFAADTRTSFTTCSSQVTCSNGYAQSLCQVSSTSLVHCNKNFCCNPPSQPATNFDSFIYCQEFVGGMCPTGQYANSNFCSLSYYNSYYPQCSQKYCCSQGGGGNSFLQTCQNSVHCKNGYVNSQCNFFGPFSNSCSEQYCCYFPNPLQESFINCATAVDCPGSYIQKRCKPRPASTEACSTSYCCGSVGPTPINTFCNTTVLCSKYAHKKCRISSTFVPNPCNQLFCCK